MMQRKDGQKAKERTYEHRATGGPHGRDPDTIVCLLEPDLGHIGLSLEVVMR